MDKVSFLHLIPFDLGYWFQDVLSLENDKNYQLVKQFSQKIKARYGEKANITFEAKYDKKVLCGYKCRDNNVDKSIFSIKLSNDLYAYILTNGIGCFLLYDSRGNKTKSIHSEDESIYEIGRVKRKSQRIILLGEYEGKETDVFSAEREQIKEFLNFCRVELHELAKKSKCKKDRTYSSTEEYKYCGLSYVLSMYLVNKAVFNEKEIEYLMYAPLTDTRCKDIKEKIDSFQIEKKYKCECMDSDIVFSWSAVAAILEKSSPKNITEIFEHDDLRLLLKQEIFIQSRWFFADTSIDNAIKNYKCKTFELQRSEAILEHYEAELEDNMSANMSTFEKKILRELVETSGIKSVYASAKRQILLQRKMKEDHDKKVKKRSILISSLFMAVFSASTLYSTINDIQKGISENVWIFLVMLILAVCTVLIDYWKD